MKTTIIVSISFFIALFIFLVVIFFIKTKRKETYEKKWMREKKLSSLEDKQNCDEVYNLVEVSSSIQPQFSAKKQ